MRRFFSVLATACLFFAAGAGANQVSYQGILTNAGGDSLLTGTYDFSFSIYPSLVGGTARWSEAHNDIVVENGVYSVLLGATTALPDSIGSNNWLQISVEGTTLSPRLPITADFRAIESRHAQNADSVNHIAARATPTANHLVPLDATGKFPESVLPFTLDSIIAGQGLTGTPAAMEQRGRNSLDERLTINVGAGTGITVSADQVSATLGTSIATAEIEDNAVTSAKVQDNTMTIADINPNIVSSVDGVSNDGGNIDLIAGANISIVPNDSANTITFTATGGGGGYSAGRCIELAGTVINNTMTIAAGDSCIRVFYDPLTCSYQLSSDLDVFAGDCIEVEYDDVTCDWTVSVDPACVDSIYDTEIYAESFVVVGDGTFEDPAAHLTNDGGLELRDGTGNEVYLNPNGTMVLVHDGVPVGGFDPNGEFYGQSFMVIDPETGDTLSHLNNQGGLELIGEDGALYLNPNGTMVMVQNGEVVGGFDPNGEFAAKSYMVIDPATGDTLIHLANDGYMYMQQGDYATEIGPAGLFIGDSSGQNGVLIDDFGNVALLGGGAAYAGINGFNGEMYARSFEVRDSLTGELKAHLDNDGNLVLPGGAQITVGGVPIGGAIGDQINFNDGPNGSQLNANGLSVESGAQYHSEVRGGSVSVYDMWDLNSLDMQSNGTWQATQNNVNVAGLQPNGEMYAKSFEVRDSLTGSLKAHLDNSGNLVLPEGAQVTVGGVPIGGGGIGDEIVLTNSSQTTHINPAGLTASNSDNGNLSEIGALGIVTMNDANGTGVHLSPDGTWSAGQAGVNVAGLQPNGEMYAKSFEVRDSLTGSLKAHLDNSGNLALPEGAQVTVGGVPIGGGGIGDQIEFEDGSQSTFVNSGGVAVIDGNENTLIGAGSVSVGQSNSGFILNGDGTWQAGQNGQTVSGLDTNGEVFAKSFYVRNPETGDTLLHITNTGQIFDAAGAVLFDGNQILRESNDGDVHISAGSGISHTEGMIGTGITKQGLTAANFESGNLIQIRSDGTWEANRDFLPIAALDSTGELIAKSFEVRDSVTGVTKAHLTNDGNLVLPEGAQVTVGGVPIGGGGIGDQIEFEDGANSSLLDAEGLSVENGTVSQSLVNGTNVAVGNDANTSYMDMQYDGTWEAKQNGVIVSSLQPNGEIHAKSFEVRDSAGGPIKAHMYIEGGVGKITMPSGTLSTGTIFGATTVYSSTLSGNTQNVSDINPTSIRAQTLVNSALTAGHTLSNNGTWTARQGSVNVAGLTNTGELVAKSFEVRDSLTGALKAHLSNGANLTLTGSQASGGLIETSAPAGNGTTNRGMLAPTQMCVNNVEGFDNLGGWMFYANGQMTQYVDGATNMLTTDDGYWQFMMPVFFGNPANFNYLSGGTVQQGIMTSGNFTINGKANVTGAVDPIICELFPAHPEHKFIPGTVVVADRNSDYVIPCNNASQTGVIGVVTPDEIVDDRGHIMVTILGYAAAFRLDGSRLEMKVKADAQYGAIRRGDLLTTSPTEGHAMVANDPKLGTIVGKALESLESGTGEIKVMVTLQ